MRMADAIKDTLTIRDVLVHYGHSEGKRGRAPCPLHHGKDLNFSYTDKVFHCFVCGASGDVIRLVQDLHGIGFQQALLRINADFGLGLTAHRPTVQEQNAQRDDERLEESYQNYMKPLISYYKGASAAHRELVSRMQAGDDLADVTDSQRELEQLLDYFINVGVIDWNWISQGTIT